MTGNAYLLNSLEKNKQPKKRKPRKPPLPWTGKYDAELFAKEVKFFFPSIPGIELRALLLTYEKKRRLVNKDYACRAIPLVLAHIRHTHTQYDAIMRETKSRSYSHAVVRRRCEQLMSQWGFIERKKLQVSMREAWKQEIARMHQNDIDRGVKT